MIKQIIECIKDYFKKRDMYAEGYDYAADQIRKYKFINGIPVREYLENKIDEAETFSCSGDFEKGVKEALMAHRLHD